MCLFALRHDKTSKSARSRQNETRQEPLPWEIPNEFGDPRFSSLCNLFSPPAASRMTIAAGEALTDEALLPGTLGRNGKLREEL